MRNAFLTAVMLVSMVFGLSTLTMPLSAQKKAKTTQTTQSTQATQSTDSQTTSNNFEQHQTPQTPQTSQTTSNNIKQPQTPQTPSAVPAERMAAREAYRQYGLGIFIHWGVYSLFGDGEWIMAQKNIPRSEYTKAASAFYPALFDAGEWVRAIKASGAKYICFTSRHHDGFSMWDSKVTDYTIVRATPYARDILKELADACHQEGIRLHLYYSLADWYREDYLRGWSGPQNDKDPAKADYDSYLRFMKAQLTELLTNYGEIGAIWFDGMWDHKEETSPQPSPEERGLFPKEGKEERWSWRIDELYELIHQLQPACLIANNHHLPQPLPGEDIQCFERDVPGQNEGGYSEGMQVSALPLETCETMNHSWGYSVTDTGYKSVEEIRALRDRVAAMGANLLLNVGPQPNGQLPQKAIERLAELK